MITLWTALLLLQHQVLLELPNVEKNPHTSSADIELGQKLYAGRCAGCHGPAGDGGKGTNLAVPRLPRAQTDLALYRIIRYGLPDTEMPAHNMAPREIWQIAAHVRQLGSSGTESMAGDWNRGALLIKGKGGCTTCHIVGGEGGLMGPALTDIGTRRSPTYLRNKLLDPGKELVSGFSMVRLTTHKGRKLTGVRLNEDTWSIQIRDDKGALHSFWKNELTDLSVEQKTPMPSYAKILNQQELDDIIACLTTAGGKP